MPVAPGTSNMFPAAKSGAVLLPIKDISVVPRAGVEQSNSVGGTENETIDTARTAKRYRYHK